MYPNGKQVSRPVTVNENEETAFDLDGAQALKRDSGPGMFDAEMTPGRMTWTKVFLVTAGVGVVAAVTFGILELKAESDYEKAVGQQQMDDIASKGEALRAADQRRHRGHGRRPGGRRHRRLPAGAAPEREGSKAAIIFTPTGGPGMAGAAATLRFQVRDPRSGRRAPR